MPVGKLVSGGQSGVDRAALDVATTLGIDYGGWCPLGGWAEDLPDPPGLLARYPALRETVSREAEVRTVLNVRDSDATLVVRAEAKSAGTDLTIETARRLGRPLLVLATADGPEPLAQWLDGLGSDLIAVNVAGRCESEATGIYDEAFALLSSVLS